MVHPHRFDKMKSYMDIIEDLKWRGLIADCTDLEELRKRLASGPTTLYAGFDPTADSLHIGNLIPLLALRRFQLAGHPPIALAGGATGRIGDPSGRTAERQLLTPDILRHNISKVKEQLSRLLDFNPGPAAAQLLDNAAWIEPISFLEFLRDVGKFFSVNMMVAKESVRARMTERESGISYTEFSYMLIQAYDFYHLRTGANCELQVGGSDQWGNITAGIELCRKKGTAQAWGLTFPLVTNADGSKFGKSVAGAIWLDRAKTSAYRFYQYFIQADDRDVVRFLKYFTFLPRETIEDLERRHTERPEGREAHQALAREVTSLIHGEQATNDAVGASAILFGGGLQGVSQESFAEVVAEAPVHAITAEEISGPGTALADILARSGLSQSKGLARKEIPQGGIYINNVRETDVQRRLTENDLLFGKYILIRKGKRNYLVLTLPTS